MEASRERVKDARIKRGDWQGQIPRGTPSHQRKRGERPTIKEAVMVSFSPAWACGPQMTDDRLFREEAPRSLHRGERKVTDSRVTDSREADKDTKLWCRVSTVKAGGKDPATGEGQSPDLPNDPHLEES